VVDEETREGLMEVAARSRESVRMDHIAGIRQPEASSLAASQYDALLGMLRPLGDEQWDAPTDCEAWTVKDIFAHLLGWAEAVTSFAEARRQVTSMWSRRKEFGNVLDAQNQVQVDQRRHLTPKELIARFEEVVPKMLRRRARVGRFGRYVPFVGPPEGLSNLGFLANVIFTRDTFMHRIDIARATDAELSLGPDEVRIVADIVRNWWRAGSGGARLSLTGGAGATYVTPEEPRAEISADAIEFCRFLAGRADRSVFETSGDDATLGRRVAAKVNF
jgi:uncharacterized protein (TIGR03083 family)